MLAWFYCVLVGEEKYNPLSENMFILVFSYSQTLWSYLSYLGIFMPWFALCSSIGIIEFLLHSIDNADNFYFQKLFVDDFLLPLLVIFKIKFPKEKPT